MVLISILLLAILFIAGLINVFFYFPTTKFFKWLQSFFFNSTTNKNSKKKINNSSSEPNNNKTIDELKKIFSIFDKNSDGYITEQELRESLKNLRIFMTDKEVEEMFMKLDSNGDGLIDLDEFFVLCGNSFNNFGKETDQVLSGKEEEEENMKEAFDVFDKDKDGLISVEELGCVLCSLGLKEGSKIEDCKKMIRKVDLDGDGLVNFDEFKKMMKSGGKFLL